MADLLEKKKTKFAIGEISQAVNLSVDTLRFYEKSNVIGPINRDSGGRRCFSQKDLDWLGFVNCLKSTGMPLDIIREYRRLMKEGDGTAARRKELMVLHKDYLEKQIIELQSAMNHINYKIEIYDEILKGPAH